MSVSVSEWSDLDSVENNQRDEQLSLNIPASSSPDTFEETLRKEGIYIKENSMSEDLEWNDSIILGAYNKAIDKATGVKAIEDGAIDAARQKASAEEAKKKEAAAIKDKFPIGSYCRALYSGDGCYYEGKVILLKEYTCMVEFVGYKNREEVELKNLKPSKGKRTRKNQIKVANETYAMNLTYASASQEANCVHLHDHEELRMSAGSAENTLNRPASCCASPEVPQNMACLAPPPVPPMPPSSTMNNSMSAMLMSWYMAGYYTGLHQNQNGTSCSTRSCCHGHY